MSKTVELELKCVICAGWGAANAGDEWCDHCSECHERHCVRGEPLPEDVARLKADSEAALAEWLERS